VRPVSSDPEAPGARALRVPLEGLTPGIRELDAEVARYIQRVHRLRPGARLRLFDPVLAVEADAELLESSGVVVRCEITSVQPSGYRGLPIVLLQALAKGDKPDLSIREATALGVARIVFVESERVVVRLEPERRATRRTRWQRIAVEAARQCGRGNLPAIQGPLPLLDVLAQTTEAQRLLLSSEGQPLFTQLSSWRGDQSLALLIGPEGGLSGSEAQSAAEHGFNAVSLGRTTLRTELACVAALGAVVAFGAWRGIGGE
jgi:16S rRNA (uracil1498-N3)-methyltransferase